MGKFHRDDAATYKHHLGWQHGFGQHVVRGDQQFGPGDGQGPGSGPGGNHDIFGGQGIIAHLHGIGSGKLRAALKHRAALFGDRFHGTRNMADHRILAFYQPRPIQRRRANVDAMHMSHCYLLQGGRGGHQNLFRRAAAIGAGAAKVAFFDKSDGLARRLCDL